MSITALASACNRHSHVQETKIVLIFSPVKSFFAERLKFYSAGRCEKETIAEWSAGIKSFAETYNE